MEARLVVVVRRQPLEPAVVGVADVDAVGAIGRRDAGEVPVRCCILDVENTAISTRYAAAERARGIGHVAAVDDNSRIGLDGDHARIARGASDPELDVARQPVRAGTQVDGVAGPGGVDGGLDVAAGRDENIPG